MKKYIEPKIELDALKTINVILASDNDGSLGGWETGEGLFVE